jgi:signal transduction histidine kinase
MTKNYRQGQILKLIRSKRIQTQEELARSETKAALNTIIASVSHELSTPLGNSLLTASTLTEQGNAFRRAMESQQLKRSELASFVDSVCGGNDLMQRNLQRAVELLKKFRQVANDQASEQRRTFDLAVVVREVLDTLAPSLKRFPQQITVDIPPGIVMDSLPGPLGQVVINLVNNTFLHAFEGRDHGVLTIRAMQDSMHQRVEMVFTDDGVGMSEKTLAQLFHPFFSTKPGQGGTGLGMMIVADLVRKALGGELDVQSTFGVGTRIAVTLPLVAPQAKE